MTLFVGRILPGSPGSILPGSPVASYRGIGFWHPGRILPGCGRKTNHSDVSIERRVPQEIVSVWPPWVLLDLDEMVVFQFADVPFGLAATAAYFFTERRHTREDFSVLAGKPAEPAIDQLCPGTDPAVLTDRFRDEYAIEHPVWIKTLSDLHRQKHVSLLLPGNPAAAKLEDPGIEKLGWDSGRSQPGGGW